jgi:aspartate aminotransferase
VGKAVSKRAKSLEPSVTLALNTRANQLKENGEDVVGLAAGEPDFDTPEVIKDAAIRAIREGKTKYTPAAGISPLREAVAQEYSEKLGVDYAPEEVVISNGAKHSIFDALYVLTDPGDEVLISTPYWVSYPEMVKLVGAVPRIIETEMASGYKLTMEQMERAISEGNPKVLLFNSPNNPAGIVYDREEIEDIARLALDAGISIISDEIYEFLVYTGASHYSPVQLVPEVKENSVVITGVSKSYAMTGWRIGFGLAERGVAYGMGAYQAHATGCPNSISQWAALAALKNGADDRERMRVEFERRRDLFSEMLSSISQIDFPVPRGAFYFLADVSGLYHSCGVSGSAEFCEKLLSERGLLLIPGGPFGCDNTVRFSFAVSENELNRAFERFKAFVKDYS